MSTTHISLDDFAFPGHKPQSAYELSYALGAPQSSSLYPHGGLDAAQVNPHAQSHFSHLPSDPTHSAAYLPDHPESYLPGYYVGMGYPHFDAHLPPYSASQRPPSPRSVYTANPVWGPEVYGAPYDATASSSTFLHNLQSVIDSSHTTQVQQNANAAQAATQQSTTPTTSWTLSGSLDPATGVFQRSVEHPRLRTAQACEKCRIRKAKCSGDHPACQRCISRGLKCEYAPERKMRGPNKNKRKSISQKREGDPADDRRNSIASVSSTISSSSDASALDGAAAVATAPFAVVNGTSRPASRGSPHSASHQSSPARSTSARPRATSIALGAIQRAAACMPPNPVHGEQQHNGSPPGRQRPPPLDLSDARQFQPNYPSMLAQYTRGGEPAYGFENGSDGRRTSLPPYLLEAYSRIALTHADHAQEVAFHEPSAFVTPASASSSAESSGMARTDTGSYLHPYAYGADLSSYLQASPTDALSVYSNPRSNSSDVSAPITPLSLSDSSGGAYDGAPELSYPQYEYGHASLDDAFGTSGTGPEHSYAMDMQAYGAGMEDMHRPKSAPDALSGGWDVAMDDETPRADVSRKLSHAGRLVAGEVETS